METLLPFLPTTEQRIALERLTAFLDSDEDVFVLKGSAGTGKTSLLSAVTQWLKQEDKNFVLAAPTGRAAQIISKKTGFSASTLHRVLYTPEALDNGSIRLVRKPVESSSPTLYIIDESSMLSDEIDGADALFQANKSLLSDFLEYVKACNYRNKVLFVGDAFQLPPVNAPESVALNAGYLMDKFNLMCQTIELQEVMRQKQGSYILDNATRLRDAIILHQPLPSLTYKRHFETIADAIRAYQFLHDKYGAEEVTFIANANKDVHTLNLQVRQVLNRQGRALNEGELVVCNQTWYDEEQPIFSGEAGVILACSNEETCCDIRFADAEILFKNPNGTVRLVQTKVVLDTLNHEKGLLDWEKERALRIDRASRNKLYRKEPKPWHDEYVGAMKLRYGYALTCHKAQGGEWKFVIIHPKFHRQDFRWLYTAVTRASQEIITFKNK